MQPAEPGRPAFSVLHLEHGFRHFPRPSPCSVFTVCTAFIEGSGSPHGLCKATAAMPLATVAPRPMPLSAAEAIVETSGGEGD